MFDWSHLNLHCIQSVTKILYTLLHWAQGGPMLGNSTSFQYIIKNHKQTFSLQEGVWLNFIYNLPKSANKKPKYKQLRDICQMKTVQCYIYIYRHETCIFCGSVCQFFFNVLQNISCIHCNLGSRNMNLICCIIINSNVSKT